MRDEEKWREKECAAVVVARDTERRRGIKEVRQEKAKGKGNLSSCLASRLDIFLTPYVRRKIICR